MRLWIDVREACREKKTGKGQWTLRCVSALLKRSDIRVTLLTDREVPPEWKKAPGLRTVRVLPAKGMWWHLQAWQVLMFERANIDVYISPTSFIVPFLLGSRVRVVPIVHDLIALTDEPHDRKARMIERFTLPRALRSAAKVCTVSAATAADVKSMFPETQKIVTVGAGPTIDEVNTWTGGGNTVLCIATLCPRKNQLRLIQAFAAVRPSVRGNTRLILVGGRGWDDEAIVELAKQTQNVEWLGFQDDATCRELLRTCSAFAYVSLQEGFGLPVLDALQVGAPVLASAIPSVQEVAGNAAVYADPLDTASITRGLETILSSKSALREKGLKRAEAFTWDLTADRLVEACRGVDKRA